ncbi:MAG: hypothetical protein R3A10_21795 [Caldilineaceae bacterium]
MTEDQAEAMTQLVLSTGWISRCGSASGWVKGIVTEGKFGYSSGIVRMPAKSS